MQEERRKLYVGVGTEAGLCYPGPEPPEGGGGMECPDMPFWGKLEGRDPEGLGQEGTGDRGGRRGEWGCERRWAQTTRLALTCAGCSPDMNHTSPISQCSKL